MPEWRWEGKNCQEQKKKRVKRDDSSVLGVELSLALEIKASHHELIMVKYLMILRCNIVVRNRVDLLDLLVLSNTRI